MAYGVPINMAEAFLARMELTGRVNMDVHVFAFQLSYYAHGDGLCAWVHAATAARLICHGWLA